MNSFPPEICQDHSQALGEDSVGRREAKWEKHTLSDVLLPQNKVTSCGLVELPGGPEQQTSRYETAWGGQPIKVDHAEPRVFDELVDATKVEDGSYPALDFWYQEVPGVEAVAAAVPDIHYPCQQRPDLLNKQHLVRAVPEEGQGGEVGSRHGKELDCVADLTMSRTQLSEVINSQAL